MLQAGSEAHRNSDWLMMTGDKSPSRTSCLALCPRTGAKALNTLKLVLAKSSQERRIDLGNRHELSENCCRKRVVAHEPPGETRIEPMSEVRDGNRPGGYQAWKKL